MIPYSYYQTHPTFAKYESQVVAYISEVTNCTISDAQAIVETHEKELTTFFELDLLPHRCAEYIDEKSKV